MQSYSGLQEDISGPAANPQGGSLTSPTAAERAGQQTHFGQTNAEDKYICAANRDNGPDATVAVPQRHNSITHGITTIHF